MRLNIASMALSFALATSRRSASAFVIHRSHHISVPTKSKTTTTTSTTTTTRAHRRPRPQRSSDTLQVLLTDLKNKGVLPQYEYGAFDLSLRASVQEETTTVMGTNGEDLGFHFPLKGKRVEDAPPRMRFAPSPTGSLHVGGARTALYNWLAAKKGQLDFPGSEAAFILRVEDTDVARSTKESERSVIQDLEWLGLLWDEGPDNVLAKYGPYRQSERSELYIKVANYLLEQGKAYRCFCTVEELEAMKAKQEAEGIPPRYDNTWRDADPALVQQKLDEGVEYTVRFKVPPGARVVIEDAVRGTVSWDAESTVGDFILLRSSGVPVYNFCVAVDDASMGITTVIRAEEHLTNTLRQGLILDALGAPRPRYAHCSLILGEDTKKLSKRHGATSCNQFRLEGFLPDAMINYLALLGWNDGSDNEIFTRDELIDLFDVDRVVSSPSIFDMKKLKWVNAQHLKMKSIEELVHLVSEQMGYVGLLKDNADPQKLKDFSFAATSLAKQMMETTRDAATNSQKVLQYALPETFEALEDKEAKEMIMQGYFYKVATTIVQQVDAGEFPMPSSGNPLEAFLDANNKGIVEDNQTGGAGNSYPDLYKTHMKKLAKDLSVKGKDLFHPIRLALTGEMSGQDVTKQLSLLSMATSADSVVDMEKAGVVSFEERINRLKKFCESIPEEYRQSKVVEEKQTKVQAKENTKNEAVTTASNTAAAAASPNVADPLDTYDGPPITSLDIRVGRINKVWVHPEADKLYCEEIDVGEAEPRQIASGLRPYMTPEEMEGRLVLVLCNLKERKLAGFPSHGMVLCASNQDHTQVKFVSPPIDAKVGERVTVPGFDFQGEAGQPLGENPLGKKKIFEKLAPFLVTSKYGVPEFLGRPFMTSAGVCTSPISDGNVA